MSERADALRHAFAELSAGRVAAFEKLFTEDAQWLGIPGSGFDGDTPT